MIELPQLGERIELPLKEPLRSPPEIPFWIAFELDTFFWLSIGASFDLLRLSLR